MGPKTAREDRWDRGRRQGWDSSIPGAHLTTVDRDEKRYGVEIIAIESKKVIGTGVTGAPWN